MAFNSIDTIIDFLEPLNKFILSDDEGYKHNQLGNNIEVFENYFPSLEHVDMVLVGCGETRGAGGIKEEAASANVVRKELYKLYHWHKDVKVADAGNIKPGATLQDTYAALKTVVAELLQHCKRVVIIGGSHDLTFAQYQVYASVEKIIDAVCVDAIIDMNMESMMPADNFLMPMLTSEPNFIRHYNHIGFKRKYGRHGARDTQCKPLQF